MANVQNLAENEEFIRKLAETESPEEAVALFEENGVTVTKEELLSSMESADAESGELNEAALDGVSGGMSLVTSIALQAAIKTAKVVRKNSWIFRR